MDHDWSDWSTILSYPILDLSMMMKLSWSLPFLSLAWWIDQSSKTREISCNSDYNDFIIIQTDSLCSLRVTPRILNVGITINCGSQCSLGSSFQYNGQCVDLFDELGIQQCTQAECNTRIYNLSITREFINEATPSDMSIQANAMDDVTNDMTMEQSQASIPTTVHRPETTNRTEAQNACYTTKPLSSSEVQVVIGVLVGLVMVLLVGWPSSPGYGSVGG